MVNRSNLLMANSHGGKNRNEWRRRLLGLAGPMTPTFLIMDMAKVSQKTNSRLRRYTSSRAVAVALVIVTVSVMLVMGACQRKPVMTHASFVHLPVDGWLRTIPLTFSPEYDDSAATYSITLAIRHDNSYRYRNLSMVVDVIAADSTVSRQTVDMHLADEYGNWTGGGFGALYQNTVPIVQAVTPDKARSIILWQSMGDCDTLQGLVNVGIITTPIATN